MLVVLHALIDIMSYYTPCVHSDTDYISKLLFVSCLAPVHLSLTSSQYISVEFATKLVQGVDLHSVCKNPQTVKIFHNDTNAVIRFGSWCLAICCLAPKIINLPSNLILCTELMLSYLESCFSKVGIVISL